MMVYLIVLYFYHQYTLKSTPCTYKILTRRDDFNFICHFENNN